MNIRFYNHGRCMGHKNYGTCNLYEALRWIKQGYDIKIGNKLINDPKYIKILIKETYKK